MYCPKCGQQQVSDEMRFCSRCGLALSGLAEWLAGRALLVKRADETQVDPLSAPHKRNRRAAKLMFFSGVLMPVFLVFSLAIDNGMPMIFPVLVFFVALVIMLYARLFNDKKAPVNSALMNKHAAETSALNSGSPLVSLSPAGNNPMASTDRPQVRTNELAQPPSVTEHTTRLLDDE